ncbi:hypothetical protein P691DRAFT_791138 [Macrolepiota fuliginosa MF-IS2]|uniref:F-box domain-containing protein n=1 Tax=Macrolepiota fuliginosa MF-IS2 TaxID=1400762 RepID=A0A9P5XE99_9AGAR|nr:hypothetical protein P691DRAFT_791138 [Macrolepiota fuliginosa MF-IS2]
MTLPTRRSGLRLNEERARLLRRCNELQPPVKKYLPPEVLSGIFQLACCPNLPTKPYTDADPLIESWPRGTDPSNWETNGPYIPVVLGSVCSFWRQVVRSTPQARTSIVLEVRHRTAASRAHLLRLYRVGLFPVLTSTRVGVFDSGFLPPAPESIPNLLAITELDLRDSHYPTHVYLTGLIDIILPWSQITDLVLASPSITTSLDILFQCKNLQSCQIRHLDSISPAPQPVHHRRGLVTLINYQMRIQYAKQSRAWVPDRSW